MKNFSGKKKIKTKYSTCIVKEAFDGFIGFKEQSTNLMLFFKP